MPQGVKKILFYEVNPVRITFTHFTGQIEQGINSTVQIVQSLMTNETVRVINGLVKCNVKNVQFT